MVTLEESERTEFEKVMTQWRETLKSIPETPACNRLWKLLSNPKHSSEEVARTIQMLKHIKELPDYLQAAMNNPNVPIYRVIRELNYYAAENPEEADGKLYPVLYAIDFDSSGLLISRASVDPGS